MADHVPNQALEQEQARNRALQRSPSNAGTGARRVASRAISPTKGQPRTGSRTRQESLSRRDPAEFENAFTIDEGELSRSNTPQSATEKDGEGVDAKGAEPRAHTSEAGGKGKEQDADRTEAATELPTEIRVKLRKLDKLESRYQDLLRSYRIAHARVQTVDAFETALREHTPLTTIADPNALVEYLNQTNLKGDLVLDELKRVSNERDTFKHRLDDAEKRVKEAYDEAAKLRVDKPGKEARTSTENDRASVSAEDSGDKEELTDGDPLGATKNSSLAAPKSPSIGIPKLSIFSPKLKSIPSPKAQQESEDLFSYDDEIPRLEGEIRTKQEKVDGLEKDVQKLKTDLAVARESTQSMVSTLEEATRETNILRESKERSEADARERQDAYQRTTKQLREDLKAAQTRVNELEQEVTSEDRAIVDDLNQQLESAKSELKTLQESNVDLQAQVEAMEKLQQKISELESDLPAARSNAASAKEELEAALKDLEEHKKLLAAAGEKQTQKPRSSTPTGTSKALEIKEASTDGPVSTIENAPEQSGVSKKNKKKKKKGAKASAGGITEASEVPAESSRAGTADDVVRMSQNGKGNSSIEDLKKEIERLEQILADKDKTLMSLRGKLKEQEGLQEEIESLRDELINVGQEHVEVKDKAKHLVQEKETLQAKITELEHQLKDAQGAHSAATAGSDQRHVNLTAQFEDLKAKATSLQTDLSAAQQLASSRFRDLENLRSSLQKAQPEINQLRAEAAEVKTTKEALTKKDAELKRIETKHEDLRAECTKLKQTITSREAEIKTLTQLHAQESKAKSAAQDTSNRAAQDVARLEKEKRLAEDNLDRVSRELLKVREDLATHRARLREIEQQYNKHRSDTEGIKEEMELKSAQYASAQSLMSSMRDQTSEMATQLKEARDRCDSLDEEVAEAHRLLSERSREGETMRRLLADVEGRSESRIREMKDRMDIAIEERDKAEEEASTAGRRRAREIEDLRNRYHDVERSLKRAEMDKEELEYAQRDWKKRREELEIRAGQSSRDVDEVRQAMTDLRDALDDSEKQVRDLEKQRAELRRSVEETQHRIEKLQKSNKTLTEELGKARESKKALESETQSSRTSLDSVPRMASPRPTTLPVSGREANGASGQGTNKVDHAYLKNVLLQFLEQKDRKYQMQLLPVLGMLLQFDKYAKLPAAGATVMAD